MSDEPASDGVVTASVLKAAMSRLKTHDHAERWLARLARREPHLAGMLSAGLAVAVRRMRQTGAPAEAVDVVSRQLRLASARLLSALQLADLRYRRSGRRSEC
jgi:hypothetical protein